MAPPRRSKNKTESLLCLKVPRNVDTSFGVTRCIRAGSRRSAWRACQLDAFLVDFGQELIVTRHDNLEYEDLSLVYRGLRKNTTVKKGVFVGFKFEWPDTQRGQQLVTDIARTIRENQTLTEFTSNDLVPTTETLPLVVEAFRVNRTLKKLSICESGISSVPRDSDTSECTGHLCASILDYNTSITDLTICYHLNTKGGITLAQGLIHNTTLQSLYLHDVVLGDAGMRALANVLCYNKTLRTLQLASCHTSRDAAEDVCRLLRHNTGLRALHLEYFPFERQLNNTDSGVTIGEALAHNNTLRALTLHQCYLSQRAGTAIAYALRTSNNRSLDKLDLRMNYFWNSGSESNYDRLNRRFSDAFELLFLYNPRLKVRLGFVVEDYVLHRMSRRNRVPLLQLFPPHLRSGVSDVLLLHISSFGVFIDYPAV